MEGINQIKARFNDRNGDDCMLFKLYANGKEKLFEYSHDIYEYIKKEVLHIEENLDLLHDIQWFCAFSIRGDSYGGSNGFLIENISD